MFSYGSWIRDCLFGAVSYCTILEPVVQGGIPEYLIQEPPQTINSGSLQMEFPQITLLQ